MIRNLNNFMLEYVRVNDKASEPTFIVYFIFIII